MKRYSRKIGILGTILGLVLIGTASAMALPPQASAKAQAGTSVSAHTSAVSTSGSLSANVSANSNSHASNNAAQASSNGQTHLAAAQLRACQNRQNAVTNIINRINTRTQNQLTLFSTIALRVETFYTTKSKTVSNYNQLVANIASAKTQANSDLAIMKNNSSFNCSSVNPKGMVEAFQGYLKASIADLQNFRTAVKNLIVAVATANGVSVSGSTQTSNTQGSTN